MPREGQPGIPLKGHRKHRDPYAPFQGDQGGVQGKARGRARRSRDPRSPLTCLSTLGLSSPKGLISLLLDCQGFLAP